MKTLFVLLFVPLFIFGQPYLKENGKTRHRFAQSAFGMDMQVSGGGNSAIINNEGGIERFDLKPQINPRIYISGVHFWGHAEFYFAFQLTALNKNSYNNVHYKFSQSDIFGTKIYPWPIQRKKLRPYFGFSFSGVTYQQFSNKKEGMGATKTRLKVPVIAGINYCTGKYLLELSVNYNYDNTLTYYISPTTKTTVYTSPFIFSVGIRKWLETTVAAEKDYLDGTTEKHYQSLKKQKKLSSWFFGVGPSSAFYSKTSSLNNSLFPFMDRPFSTFFPEASAGYFYEPLGLHIGSAFRYNVGKREAYSVKQTYRRTSVSVEAFKYLFDYNGFAPYAGVCGSYEWLNFSHKSDSLSFSSRGNKPAAGIIFGWDILPDKLQSMCLRTNLRYFPNLDLNTMNGKKVFFDQFEFNFIQLVIYPSRIKNFRKEYQN